MFGVFLFLTYYLQPTLRFSPIETGLAFLPMVGALMLTATTTSAAVLPRVGPKPLVTAGMLLAAVRMLLLTLRSDFESSHRAGARAAGMRGHAFGALVSAGTVGGCRVKPELESRASARRKGGRLGGG